MPLSTPEFIKEIQGMVRRKHSKDHPVIDTIENGRLTPEQVKAFVDCDPLYSRWRNGK
ncbi:MAG: hypothetical protein HYY46_09160 [Deltaproteobacteria bacterium]|nr:hypothetical protein [Deltaproteobacteria bacterium]